MRLLLLADDGTVLDSGDTFTRDELDNLSPAGALALITESSPGNPPA